MNEEVCLDNVIDSIEQLKPEDQELAIEIIKKRLIERRREEIAKNIDQARSDYKENALRSGNLKDLFDEVDS